MHRLLTFLVLAIAIWVTGQAEAADQRMYVMIEEADRSRLSGVDELSAAGVEVILLIVDRYSTLLKDMATTQQQMGKFLQKQYKAFDNDKSLFEAYLKRDFDRQHLRPLIRDFSGRLRRALPEQLVIGELAEKHNLQETPAIVLEAGAGYKYLYRQTNLVRAYETLQRRDYVKRP